jgi:glycosyltransferase involved in cell wall biosynthesis
VTGARLRVGLVVPRFAPFRGGVETYTGQAARALAARGADLTVITQVPRRAGLPARSVRDGYAVERHRLPVGASFDVPSPGAVRAAARTGRFDVVWVHSYHTPLAWLVAERTTTPLVLTPHYHGTGHSPLRAALHRPYRLAGRRLLAASRRVVVDTEAEAGLLRRHFAARLPAAKVAVVPLAVDAPAGAEPFPGTGPVILSVARQEPYKRTDLLIRAVAELRRRGVPARLVVVGDGSALGGHRSLVDRLGVREAVTMAGPLDDETLARWWASASLYVTASEHEAFGISLAQALLAGLPVAASGISAHREVVRRAGPAALAELVTADAGTGPGALCYADAIEKLLTDAGPRRERANECALPTLSTMADALLDVLVTAAA